MSRPIRRSSERSGVSASYQSHSLLATSPIAQMSIQRDIDDAEEEEGNGQAIEDNSEIVAPSNHNRSDYSMVGSYRRISAVAYGPRPLFPAAQAPETSGFVSQIDREAALGEERSLLRDNKLIPPKHPRSGSNASGKPNNFFSKRLSVAGFIPRKGSQAVDEDTIEDADGPDETTPLVRDPNLPYGGQDAPEEIDKKWEEAVASGKIQTTWQREAKVLFKYSRPLMGTFLLQYSLTVVSIFTVGHIGKIELGAISLASMSANITGYAVYIGLATSLDTLCAQAYGSGRKTLVGLQLQRMVYFLWTITIPIACIWAAGPQILRAIVPEKETADLAGQYLRVLIIGAPGYAAFESGKRYVQAQGLFQATLYCLLICAPLNVFLHWLFVWHFGWGFIGAPIAVVCIENLLPITLFLYVRFVGGMECWAGFSRKAFTNWGPMVRLALPGLIMVLAEFLAFEILTLSASWISSTHLATQSVLSTISSITFQIPFPISIAASTRIANLIGATLPDAGKVAAKVALFAAFGVGLMNAIILVSIRDYVPWLFTSDPDVAALTSKVLPINAAFQVFDALAALCNGILRGLGRQEVGGYVNLFAYYAASRVERVFRRSVADVLYRLQCPYLSELVLDYTGICTGFGL